MKIFLTLLFAAFASNADAIGINQPNLAGQIIIVEDIRPLDNLWSGENFYNQGIFLIDNSVTPSTWQLYAVDGSTVVLTRLDGSGTFYFTITSPPQFGVGVVPDGTANIYAGIIKATDSIIVANDLTAGGTVQATLAKVSTVSVGGFNIQTFDSDGLTGIAFPIGSDQGIGLFKTGALGLDEAYGYALVQDDVIVGYMAYVDDNGEKVFFLGGNVDPTVEGVIRFRGTAAGAFAGDVDILSATAAGSAIHVLMPTQFHVQGQLYLGGALGVSDSTHQGSNGHTNDLLCFKSNGQVGNMAQSGGTITTGVCN